LHREKSQHRSRSHQQRKKHTVRGFRQEIACVVLASQHTTVTVLPCERVVRLVGGCCVGPLETPINGVFVSSSSSPSSSSSAKVLLLSPQITRQIPPLSSCAPVTTRG
jgi:hypothetical protein